MLYFQFCREILAETYQILPVLWNHHLLPHAWKNTSKVTADLFKFLLWKVNPIWHLIVQQKVWWLRNRNRSLKISFWSSVYFFWYYGQVSSFVVLQFPIYIGGSCFFSHLPNCSHYVHDKPHETMTTSHFTLNGPNWVSPESVYYEYLNRYKNLSLHKPNSAPKILTRTILRKIYSKTSIP